MPQRNTEIDIASFYMYCLQQTIFQCCSDTETHTGRVTETERDGDREKL